MSTSTVNGFKMPDSACSQQAGSREKGPGIRHEEYPRAGDETWPACKPLPDDLPPVKAFNFAWLPDILRLWLADIAERMQCPRTLPSSPPSLRSEH